MTGAPPRATAGTGLSRILRCFQELLNEPEGVSMPDLCSGLQVGRRTVFRYLDRLKDAGFPLVFDRARATYRLAHTGPYRHLAEWHLNWSESVVLIASMLRMGADPELNAITQDILERFRPALNVAFGERAGSIWANARLLASGTQPLSRIEKVMKDYWDGAGRSSGLR
jgi:predicted DNA-binding transcriptional regulator YafY